MSDEVRIPKSVLEDLRLAMASLELEIASVKKAVLAHQIMVHEIIQGSEIGSDNSTCNGGSYS